MRVCSTHNDLWVEELAVQFVLDAIAYHLYAMVTEI